MESIAQKPQYEVLNPWADVDTVAPRGIAPRLNDLADKKIGLFCNFKIAAGSIMDKVEAALSRKFPSAQFSRFIFVHNLWVGETEEKNLFDEWVKGVDAVVAAVGD
jgi:hypothetical protein